METYDRKIRALPEVIRCLELCYKDECENCDYCGHGCSEMLGMDSLFWLKELLNLSKVQRSMLEKASEVQKTGDLISLSDLMKFPIRIDHYDKENGNEHFVYGIETVLEYAENLPRVETEPVVHAHWVEDDHGCCRNCSACGFRVGDDTSYDLYGDWKIAPKRCPECGAHMDEEVSDGDTSV